MNTSTSFSNEKQQNNSLCSSEGCLEVLHLAFCFLVRVEEGLVAVVQCSTVHGWTCFALRVQPRHKKKTYNFDTWKLYFPMHFLRGRPKLACKLLKSVFNFKEQTAITRLSLVQMVSNFRRTFLGRLPLHHPKIKEIKKMSIWPSRATLTRVVLP